MLPQSTHRHVWPHGTSATSAGFAIQMQHKASSCFVLSLALAPPSDPRGTLALLDLLGAGILDGAGVCGGDDAGVWCRPERYNLPRVASPQTEPLPNTINTMHQPNTDCGFNARATPPATLFVMLATGRSIHEGTTKLRVHQHIKPIAFTSARKQPLTIHIASSPAYSNKSTTEWHSTLTTLIKTSITCIK